MKDNINKVAWKHQLIISLYAFDLHDVYMMFNFFLKIEIQTINKTYYILKTINNSKS